MTRSSFKASIAACMAVLALAACTTQPTGNTVRSGSQQQAQSVAFGTITGSRAITVEGNAPGEVVGTIGGGLAGGLIGNEIGGGLGRDIATVVGATAGAAAGNRAAQELSKRQSIEWFVQLDSGQTISVVQSEPTFGTGQRVQVVQGSSGTRLVPA